jgi:serine/threonine-protein kinase
LIDTGEVSDRYLVLEYIEGPSLKDALERNQIVPGGDRGRTIALELCRAVDFLNTRGVSHLDLQPGNVLLRDRESPVLIDFNTARTDTAPDTLFQGGRYKPPELRRSGRPDAEVGPWSDVYSLALVITHLLMGNKPDSASAARDGLERVSFDRGRDLDGAVEEALQVAPRDRSSTPKTMFESLLGRDSTAQHLRIRDDSRSFDGCLVIDGDTVGRDGGITANLTVTDERQFVSPIHFAIERDAGQVRIRDRSLNGTYVRGSDGWAYILSESGQKRRHNTPDVSLRESTEAALRAELPAEIRPVDTEYGIQLHLAKSDFNRSSV